jgi:hypothetical protein
MTARYVLTFAPAPHPEGVPPLARLRALLKHAGRALYLRCTDAREESPMPAILFVLDREHERRVEDWPSLPSPGDVLCFGPPGEDGGNDAVARVAERWYFEAQRHWEVLIERLGVDHDELTEAEADAWRAAGFDVHLPPAPRLQSQPAPPAPF